MIDRRGCLGCINLSDLDGRLICMDEQSPAREHVHYPPGPGCPRKTGRDKIYGRVGSTAVPPRRKSKAVIPDQQSAGATAAPRSDGQAPS